MVKKIVKVCFIEIETINKGGEREKYEWNVMEIINEIN